MNVESAVRERYANAANARENALCCPVDYNRDLLKVIPQEVIDRDYGCGDPSRYLREGETVLDLGSGTGKICFIAAQVVGAGGRVIGVDMTDDMLNVARRNAPLVAQRLGFANVEFRKGRIQDLALDLEAIDRELQAHPITNAQSYLAAEELAAELRKRSPLIANDSIDAVVSNCVLNLVEAEAKRQLFGELFRVLRHGGRAIISDIVCDEHVPEDLQRDPELWSGCISGALREDEFLRAFEDAGFQGITILKRDPKPWRQVKGIEFRSVTVQAFKVNQGAGLDLHQAVIYKGPFKEVLDDAGHRLERGLRHGVSDKTFGLYASQPYKAHFELIEPHTAVALDAAKPFARESGMLRDPKDTKSGSGNRIGESDACCEGGKCC